MDQTPPLPEAIPTPAGLAAALAAVGLEAQVTVQRRDGKPLEASDLAAVRRIVTGLDADAGPGFTDEAAEDAAIALAMTPAFAPTDTTPPGDRER
jgi:hypothetical protein